MRVVAGLYRHRELILPLDKDIRPSKDMVKEGMFSALMNKVNNAVVLDLFAGSGALGIEAISRGAKSVYFVDKNINAHKVINQNLANLKINNAENYLLDYKEAIFKFAKMGIKFDLVLLDPPYKLNLYQEIIDLLENNHLVKEDSVFVLESDYEISINKPYKKIKDYKYGKTLIKILWK